jgi:16S rRNA (adenine1518-N6/adenine1519-N6)-dimethyltransferase
MTLTEIKDICKVYNIVPTKSRGQNFLFDQNIIAKIIKSANLSKKDVVLEIGPGLGVLTEHLVRHVKRVVAVELDKKIIEFLSNKYKENTNLEVIEGDILRVDIDSLGLAGGYKIVANLPYNITSNFIRKFLEADNSPTEMIIMVQYEVAKRMIEKPGKMSILAVAVQFYSEVEILFKVDRNSFWPSPKVDSAVIKIKMKKKPDFDNPKHFFRIVKMGFSAKRKQLQNNLSGGLHRDREEIKQILQKVGLDEKIRAQDLSIKNWIDVIKKI